MPIYEFIQDSTGETIELEGDRPPKKEDIERAFAFIGKQKYPNAPVLQAPPSLYEQAKSVAPAFARVAAPFAFGAPMPQDVATIGRTMQQVTGGDPKQGMLEGASRIDKEGIMALLSASPEKRELGSRLGRKLGEVATEQLYIPEYVTRPAGEVAGQVAADLLSPMNLMTLGVAGAAGEATRIPSLVAGAEFAETTTPSAVRAAQIADFRRASGKSAFPEALQKELIESGGYALKDSKNAVEQVGKAIPAILAPEVTRGAAESTGIALQTIADPEATPEQKLKASYEAAIGTLFAAGLGTQVARSFGMRGKGVTQADVLDNLASRKQTVGEAVGQVGGLIDQMDRIVPVGDLKTQFRELIAGMNPDEPFIYRPEPIGEGPRAQVEGGRLPVGEVVEEAPETLRTQDQILAERLRSRDERIAADEQKALEREAARAGTPLRTAEEVQAQRSAERQALRERAAAIREAIGRREFTSEDLMRGEAAPEAPIAEPVSRPLVTPELTVERAAPREGGMLPPREAEIAPAPEGTALRSTEDILAERLRLRDERIAAEQEAAARTSTPIETVEQKLSRALASRDRRLAAEAVSETLESGAAQGEPTRVTRKKVEQAIGIGREEAGRPVAEQTIFNEVWNKALEETQGKFRQKAEGVAGKLEGLRVEVEPGVGANPFPQLMGAAWNGALSVAQAVIRAGGSIADGVAAGLRYAKQNFKEKFDEAEFSNELTRTIQRPSAIAVPPKMEPRSFAERAAAAPGIPPQIREAVAESPRASYERQSFDQLKQQVASASTAELLADIADPKSNTKTASSQQLILRLIEEGNDAETANQTLKLAEEGTRFGQLVSQFKLFKSATREGVILLAQKELANKGKTLSKEQANKLGNAFDQYRSALDAFNRAQLKAKDAANNGDSKSFTVAWGLSEMADALRLKADFNLSKEIGRINPASIADLYISMVQGSVLSTTSIIGNILGNVINMPLRAISNIVAKGIDEVLYGGKNNAYNIRARTISRMEEWVKSVPGMWNTMLKGADAKAYELGAVSGSPLNFNRAWREIVEDFSSGGEIRSITKNIQAGEKAKIVSALGRSARNIIEGTLGVIPDLLLRASQATDQPFKLGEQRAIVEEIGKQRGLSPNQIKLAIKNPKLLLISEKQRASGQRGFTAEDLGVIDFEVARSVFQQSNIITQLASSVNRFVRKEVPLGEAAYPVYRNSFLFQKTPINVAAEYAQFTPLGIFRDWKNMNIREREIAASRLLVGIPIFMAYSYLYDKGLITPNLETPGETNKARELSKSGGVMPPGTINMSGLYRHLKGEDPSFRPNDTVKELSALGTHGGIGLMVGTARRLQERSRTNEDDFLGIAKAIGLTGINFVMNQKNLKGATDFIKLLTEESESSFDRWLKNYLVTAGSPFYPNILGTLKRAQRENLPSIGGEGFIKDAINEINQRYSALGLALPGVKNPDAMPVRRDLWGNAVKQTPNGSNPWTYNFFNSWKSREIDADPLNASIYRLWRRTADNTAIPSLPNPVLTYHDKTFERMTPDQYDRYSQLVGFYRRGLAERVYMSGQYNQSGDEVRLRLLQSAYERGLSAGKHVFLSELAKSGRSLTPRSPRRGFQEE